MEDKEQAQESSTGVMKKCPDCGKDVSARATSCPNCGAPLQATMQACPDCGKEISIYATSCPNCGRPMEAAARTDIKPVNMGFSLIALPIIIILCSWASIEDFRFWSGISLFVIIFALFIGIESYRNRKIKEIGNPLLWALGAFFFYPIVYPWYMFKRKEIRLDSPLKWISIPLAIITLGFWVVSFDQPVPVFYVNDFPVYDTSDYTSDPDFQSATIETPAAQPAVSKASYDEIICKNAKISMTEFLATDGSDAPSCTSVTIVKKVSPTRWIGKATTSNGKSGEITIDIMSLGESDPDPVVVVMPVELTDFVDLF